MTDDGVTPGSSVGPVLVARWSIRATYDWVESSNRHLVKPGAAPRF
ncbi:hypothetical protein [Thermaurantiacus sp.]